jgi:hypothetical protein
MPTCPCDSGEPLNPYGCGGGCLEEGEQLIADLIADLDPEND